MRIVRQLAILASIGLLGAAAFARAEVPGLEDVALADGAGSCAEARPQLARSLADQAFRAAAFQRAAECYLAAGEPALANEAFLKEAARASNQTAQRLDTNAVEVKLQISQLKQAFSRR